MTTDTPSDTPAANPSLGLNDIAFLLQIVEICSKRGAFNADEMTSVGTVYDKVKSFVAANTPAQTDAKPEGTE